MRRLTVLLVASGCGFSTPASTGDDVTPGIDAAIDVPSIAFDPARCPASFVPVTGQSTRYNWLVVTNAQLVGWSIAEQRCESMAAISGYVPHLAVYETVSERDAVWNTAGPTFAWVWAWTGAFEVPAGATYRTVIGTPSTPVWGTNEPQGRGSTTHAIAVGNNMAPTGDLSVPRDWNEQVICECDGKGVIAGP